MKKILILILILTGFGMSSAFAQQVDVELTGPDIEYSKIPVKQNPGTEYTISATYEWDSVGAFFDSLAVALNAELFAIDTLDSVAFTSIPDTLITRILKDTTNFNAGSAVNATWQLSEAVDVYAFTGAKQATGSESAGAVTGVTYNVDVNADQYSRHDGTSDGTLSTNDYNGSLGAAFEFQADDHVTNMEWQNTVAADVEYSVSVFTSGGSEVLTTPILLTGGTGTDNVSLNVDMSGGTTYYFMINQKTTTALTINKEAGNDGEVIAANGSGGFMVLDTADLQITLTTTVNTAPEFATVPGNQFNFYVGMASSGNITATDDDGDDLTLTLSDTVPSFNVDWLTFVDNGDGTGKISGTPTKANIGTVTATFSVTDGVDEVTYVVKIRVSDQVEFDLPYSETFGNTTTVNGGIPSSWTLLQDVDESGNTVTWGEDLADAEYIGSSAKKQNEILVSAPIKIPALDATVDTTFTLSFDINFNGDESNWVGGILGSLGSGSDGDGNFADFDVWIFASDSTIVYSDDDDAQAITDGGGSLTPEIDLADYAGQTIRVAFQVTSNNSNNYSTDLYLDNVAIDLNEEVDLSVIVRSDYAEIPASQIDETNGHDFHYYIISRGHTIPDDATITINVTGDAGGVTDADFESEFSQFLLDPADFVDGVYEGVITVNPNWPDYGDDFGYQVSVAIAQADNVPTGSTSESDVLYVGHASSQWSFVDGNIDNSLANTVFDSEGTDHEYTIDDTEGIGTIIELVNTDYLGGVTVDFDAGTATQTFKIDIISIASRSATSGTLIATIDDDGGAELTADTYDDIEVLADDDFDEYIKLDAGLYVIMVTPTNPDDAELDIWSTEEGDDRADYGEFIRGTVDNLYSGHTYEDGSEDDGDIDIRAFFGDPINYSIIAYNRYDEIPRSQIDITNGYDFMAYVIKRGGAITDDLELTMNVSRTYNGAADADYVEIDSVKILTASDFTGDTAVVTLNVMLELPKPGDDFEYTFDATISATGNNAWGSTNQSVSVLVGENAGGDYSLIGNADDNDQGVSSEGFGKGLGEVFTLVRADYIESIYVDWFAFNNIPISISIISLTDENATSGTVVATINDNAGTGLKDNTNTYTPTDDNDISEDIYLEAGTYVVMINPTDPNDNVFEINGSEAADDKADYGDFVRGKASNIYRDEEDTGDLIIGMVMAANGAPQFYDPRQGNLSTSITKFDMREIEGVAFSESVVIKDPQVNDVVSVSFVDVAPSFLTITSNSSGFDLEVDNTSTEDNYTVQLYATDGLDTTVLDVNIYITANPAPYFNTAPAVVSFEGKAYSYVATGKDPLGENITAAMDYGPSWITATVSAGADSVTLTGTPTGSDLGSHAVKLSLTDDSGNTAEQSFIINVFANSTPYFTSFPPREGHEGDSYFYRLTASDDEGTATLTFAADSLPDGFTLVDKGNGIAEVATDALAAGTHFAEITVTDGLVSVSQSWTIEVSALNQAPVFTSVPDEVDTVTYGTAYEYNITFEDPDGDNVQLSGTTLPSWMVLINEGAGQARLLGNPTAEQEGNHDVVLTITDGQASASQSFFINVGVPAASQEGNDGGETAEAGNEEEDATADEKAATTSVEMYPNPAHSFLTIKSVKKDVTVSIYDQAGGLIKAIKMEEGSSLVDINGIKPGIYLVRVGGDDKLHRVVIN